MTTLLEWHKASGKLIEYVLHFCELNLDSTFRSSDCGWKSYYIWKKTKTKCFYSRLVNKKVLRLEDVKIKRKYLELPFGAEISCCAGHPPSTTLPHLCGCIKTIVLCYPNYQIIFKQMDVNDVFDNKWEVKGKNPPMYYCVNYKMATSNTDTSSIIAYLSRKK